MYLSEKRVVFEGGENQEKSPEGIFSYRIPALLKTKEGTLIAGADQRHNHHFDWGNIDMVIRRSEDQGETWSEIITVLDLPTNPTSLNLDFDSAFLIDMNLIQDPVTSRIYSIYDMYPEQRGLFGMLEDNKERVNEGLDAVDEREYSLIDSKYYLNLYNKDGEVVYLADDEGKVYDQNMNQTEMKVVLKSNRAPYSDLGNLYDNDKLIGNIYFAATSENEYRIANAAYIWVSHSDDDGKSWSSPKDITPQIKLPWMKFYGVGPGIGLVLKYGEHKGRLIVPTYSTNHSYELDYSQSARVIYSDDHGENWISGQAVNDNRILDDGTVIHSKDMYDEQNQNTEACAVELSNGMIKMFMRNKSGLLAVATSTDGGESWFDRVEYLEDINDVYVQLSAIQTIQKGKEYILLTNSNGPGRTNGTVHLAEVGKDGELTWINKKLLQGGEFAYNALQQIDAATFACLFEHNAEHQNPYSIYLRKFDWDFIINKSK